jgi:hypothetical protein
MRRFASFDYAPSESRSSNRNAASAVPSAKDRKVLAETIFCILASSRMCTLNEVNEAAVTLYFAVGYRFSSPTTRAPKSSITSPDCGTRFRIPICLTPRKALCGRN